MTISASSVEFYLNWAGVSQEIQDEGSTLVIRTPSPLVAEGLIKSAGHLAQRLKIKGQKKAIIHHPLDEGNGVPIFSWYSGIFNSGEQNIVTGSNSAHPDKPVIGISSSHDQILDFLKEKSSDGLVVLIASQETSDILYVNDNMPVDRVLCKPGEMYNRKIFDNNYFWRDTMGDRDRMFQLLEQDGFIPAYEHKIRRRDDSMAKFAHDFYLINWGGCRSRLVVSRPGEYEIVPEESLVLV